VRERNRVRAGLIAGINITPLTDVVLVLLVIFMIATPLLMRSEIKVNLPRTADAAAQKNIVVTIDSAGNVYVDGGRVALAQLAPTLSATLGKRPNAPVIIMGDRDVRYDLVVRVLEIARTSGVNKLSLAVEVKK
jgi:biopolymer transport protein ExbD